MSPISKKRYYEIDEALGTLMKDQQEREQVMMKICEILNFDPNRNTYTPQVKERMLQWRKKKAEELGVTTYVTSGMKAYYERNKQSQVKVT
jgi:chorismate mutase